MIEKKKKYQLPSLALLIFNGDVITESKDYYEDNDVCSDDIFS